MIDESGSDAMKVGGEPIDAAIAWHLRLPTASREEWQAFIAWLEESPANAATYDELTLDDDLLAPSLAPQPAPAAEFVAANDAWEAPSRWRHARWAVPALAAALAVAVALPRLGGDGPVTIETAPGARKLVAFADGSRITVNGGSQLVLKSDDTRYAALERGEATFEIRHDAAHPFVVKSGGLTLHDLGTVFNVVRDGQRLGLEVSEGAVMFEPQREALTIRPGVALDVDEKARRVVFSHVATTDVGAWRHGRLIFSADRLADVASAVGRATGERVTVDSGLADTPFTGSLRLRDGRAGVIARLASLSGNRAERDGDAWKIVPAGHAPD